MQSKEFHQLPHTYLQAESLTDLQSLGFGNAADQGKPFRLPFHHKQGLIPKHVHDLGGGFRTDALDCVAGKVG